MCLFFVFFDPKEEKMVRFKDICKDPELNLQKKYYYSEQEIESRILSKGYIPFINSYDIFLCCINKYLNKINDINIKKQILQVQDGKNYVGRILRVLDHAGYYYSFMDFEEKQVVGILEKWCSDNRIVFSPYTLL